MAKKALYLMVACLFLLTGCAGGEEPGNDPGEAQELPEEAQEYIELARLDLALRLAIEPNQIELESITSPAEVDGTYIVVVNAGGEMYEYHGRDGEVMLVSDPLPTAES